MFSIGALRGIDDDLTSLVGSLDPDAVAEPEAVEAWTMLDRLERKAAAAKTLLARRVDDSMAWMTAGYRSAAECLAAAAGTSVSAARVQLETSRRVAALPAVAEAMVAGELPAAKAAVVADAAAAAPAAVDGLLSSAARTSLAELRDECLKTKAAADPDREATHARVHRERYLTEWVDGEHGWNLRARGTLADGALVRRALQDLADRRFAQARRDGERERPDAYAFDALVHLARQTLDGVDGESQPKRRAERRVHHTIIFRVDWEAFRRGAIEGDEVCEVAGLGPVPLAAVHDVLGDAVAKLVITKGVGAANVTHLGRGPTVAQRVALAWTSPTCTVEGCTRLRVEFDHREDWAWTHHTVLHELDPLCHHHHDLKTKNGWALTDGTGKRPLVPPDDPRYPRDRPPPSPRPPRASRPRPHHVRDP